MSRVMLHVLAATMVLAAAACSGSSGPTGSATPTTGPPTSTAPSTPAVSSTPPPPTGGHAWRITYRSNLGGRWQTAMTTGSLTRDPAGVRVSAAALRRCGFDPATDALLPLHFVDSNPGIIEVRGSGAGFRLTSSVAGVVAPQLRADQAVRFVSDSASWGDDRPCSDLTSSLQLAGYFDERPLAPQAARTVRAVLLLDNVAPAGERSTLGKLWFSVLGSNGSVGDTEAVTGPRVGELGSILLKRTRWYFPVDGTSVFDCAAADDDRRTIARCRATPAGAA